MEEHSAKESRWIRLYQAGTATEFSFFLLFSLIGGGLALAFGFHNLISMLIMAFGLPRVCWGTVHKLALEDGLQEADSGSM